MMQGNPKVDELMCPVNAAIKRHVKDRDAATEIYNRAYEAVMEVQDALNVSAAVAAKQIAENAKNLKRAEAAEARAERLQAALADIAHGPVGTWNEPQHAAEVIKFMMRVASDALKGGAS